MKKYLYFILYFISGLCGCGNDAFAQEDEAILWNIPTQIWRDSCYKNTPSPTDGTTINLFINREQIDGNASLYDRAWFFTLGSSAYTVTSLFNYGGTSSTESNCILVNSPTFVPYTGISGNGVNAYINSRYVAASSGINYTLNNCSEGAYCSVNPTNDAYRYEWGVQANCDAYALGSFNQPSPYYKNIDINDFTENIINNSTVGLLSGTRLNSTQSNIYVNGSLIQTSAIASVCNPDRPMTILCYNGFGGPSYFSNATMQFIYFGSGNISQSGLYASLLMVKNRQGGW